MTSDVHTPFLLSQPIHIDPMSTNHTVQDEHLSGSTFGGPGYTPHGTHPTTTASGEQPETRTNAGNQVSGGIK